MLQSEYKKFMKEYLDLGHMTRVDAQSSIIRYYMPHHGIIKNTSLTTKLRVVFKGSVQTLSRWSVNDSQHVGPSNLELHSSIRRQLIIPMLLSILNKRN